MRVTSLSSLLAAGFVLISSAATAQTPAMICGKVTDATGGVMPGVAVTLKSQTNATSLLATATTDAKGTYLFPSVSIGTYTLQFDLDGFKRAVRPNNVITTGFALRVDERMQVASPVEELTMTPPPATVAYDRRVTTGATFTKDILENVPTGRTANAQPMGPCVVSHANIPSV